MDLLLGIIKKVKLKLQLGDDAKVEAFYIKQAKLLEKDIKALNKNKELYKDQFDAIKEEYAEKVADASDELEEAYLGITANDVKTNDAANAFAKPFWERIYKAEARLVSLKEQHEEDAAVYEQKVADIDKAIQNYSNRLDRLKSED